MIEAVRNNVLPLNASQVAVLTVERPGPAAGRTQFVYTTPNTSNQFAVAPSILNRSYTITAEIEVPQGGANGVLVTQGGRFSGYGLYLKDGKPTFTMNLLDLERPKWQSPARCRPASTPLSSTGRWIRRACRSGGEGGHALGERQAGGPTIAAPYPAVHLGLGRDVRRRPRHRHVGRRFRLSGSSAIHRQAGEDHLRPRRNEHDAGGHQGDDGGAGEEAGSVKHTVAGGAQGGPLPFAQVYDRLPVHFRRSRSRSAMAASRQLRPSARRKFRSSAHGPRKGQNLTLSGHWRRGLKAGSFERSPQAMRPT